MTSRLPLAREFKSERWHNRQQLQQNVLFSLLQEAIDVMIDNKIKFAGPATNNNSITSSR